EFRDAESLVAAATRVHQAGYRHVEAYSPMPVEGLADAIGFRRTRMPLVVLIGGIVGLISGDGLQYYCAVISYPINIGGRPLHSWPAFIPVTFEMTVLGAALFAVLGMLAMNGLPMPYHPVFNVPRFALATRDRFFLCIEAGDGLFDRKNSADLLREFGACE